MAELPQIEVAAVPDPVPDDLVVLDVREPDEWAEGHIAGALHVPMMTIPEAYGSLPTERRLLVVCHVGARSARVTQFLQQQGVDAVNLAGGMVAWERAGRAVVVDGPAEA